MEISYYCGRCTSTKLVIVVLGAVFGLLSKAHDVNYCTHKLRLSINPSN